MEETWESLFKKQAVKKKHSDEYINECMQYAFHLHEKNLPVIFDINHLSEYWNLDIGLIKSIIECPPRYYAEYDIRKKSGGTRHLCAPHQVLKYIQRWIYHNILLKDITISEHVHGFIPKDQFDSKRTILSNAQAHAKCKWLINMDLKDFFNTIKQERVKKYFLSIGYTEDICELLAKLCTLHYRLPQGAPTSPTLSNLIAREMDKELECLCAKNHWCYTRYADDLTFSGIYIDETPSINELEKIIIQNGFLVNRQKTKFRLRGNCQMVTGLTVTHGVFVPKKYRKEVWKELYCCKKFTPYAHCQYRYPDKGFYKDWLKGRIMFIRSIDPACGNKMLDAFNQLKWVL